MLQNKSQARVAIIREADCIGCTKCIAACPADAILGRNKMMHTVITDECIGCELCIAPCPVDCIEMILLTTPVQSLERAALFKKRYHARKKRLENKATEQETHSVTDKKSYIQAALERAQKKQIGQTGE